MDSNYYIDFENKFRGSRQNIIDRLSIYDDLIATVLKSCSNPAILDIGCGRGEFLERWSNKGVNSVGIERDKSMIRLCRNHGLNIIDDDAIEALTKIENDSFSIISIFHMVEHMEHRNLFKLIKECRRILRPQGILIIETPSIDSLLVSSKSFYLDPTHINHIHPDSLSFTLEKLCFAQAKFYYLNGAPLQEASPLKITRILNGVAQDLLLVAAKSEDIAKTIFNLNNEWEQRLDIAPTTLEVAIEYDLENERLLKNSNEKIKLLTDQYNILIQDMTNNKDHLKYIIFPIKKIKALVRSLLKGFKFFKIILLSIGSKLFNILINNKFTRKIILSRICLIICNLLLNFLRNVSSDISIIKMQEKLNQLNRADYYSDGFNNFLYLQYRNSINAKQIKIKLRDYKKRNK